MYNNNFNRDAYEPDFGEREVQDRSTLGTVSEMLDNMNRRSFRKIWESVNDYRCQRQW